MSNLVKILKANNRREAMSQWLCQNPEAAAALDLRRLMVGLAEELKEAEGCVPATDRCLRDWMDHYWGNIGWKAPGILVSAWKKAFRLVEVSAPRFEESAKLLEDKFPQHEEFLGALMAEFTQEPYASYARALAAYQEDARWRDYWFSLCTFNPKRMGYYATEGLHGLLTMPLEEKQLLGYWLAEAIFKIAENFFKPKRLPLGEMRVVLPRLWNSLGAGRNCVKKEHLLKVAEKYPAHIRSAVFLNLGCA